MAAKKTETKGKEKNKNSPRIKGLTKADVLRKCKQLSNWGKWGPKDELGVLNYITQEDIDDQTAPEIFFPLQKKGVRFLKIEKEM